MLPFLAASDLHILTYKSCVLGSLFPVFTPHPQFSVYHVTILHQYYTVDTGADNEFHVSIFIKVEVSFTL